MIAALKAGKYNELVKDDGIAIIEAGTSFGGGQLCNYGINSNTSAQGFLKCMFRKVGYAPSAAADLPTFISSYANQGVHKTPKVQTQSKSTIKRQVSQMKQRPQQSLHEPVLSSTKPADPLTPKQTKPDLIDKDDPSTKAVDEPDLNEAILPNSQEPPDTETILPEPPVAEIPDQAPITEAVNADSTQPAQQKQANKKAVAKTAKKQLALSPPHSGANPVIASVTKTKQVQKKASHLNHSTNPAHSNTNRMKNISNTPQISALSAKKQVLSMGLGSVPQSRRKDSFGKEVEQKKGGVVFNQEDVMTPFKDLFNSKIVNTLKTVGKQILPLSVVGHFLNYVGNHLLHYTHVAHGRKIFFPKHRALSVQLMGNGQLMTQVLRTEFHIESTMKDGQLSYNIVEGAQKVVYFRSKSVVIAAGASQGLDPSIPRWFPGLSESDKLIPSDAFLKRDVYLRTLDRLSKLGRPPRVVIIGGSHSGFSCAWMLLNGPAMFNSCSKHINTDGSLITKVPYANRKIARNCTGCCKCNSQTSQGEREKSINARLKSRDIGKRMVTEQTEDQPAAPETTTVPTVCNCICKCFGFFRYDEWPNMLNQDEESDLKLKTLPTISDGQIKILYRSKLRVFFKKGKDAMQAGYTDYPTVGRDVKKDGYVYAFTGLRGNAKQLYMDVTEGREKRVEFVKAESPEAQLEYVDKADLVVWACGYQSNAVKIFDQNKRELALSQKVANTQFDIDGKNRIMLADGNVLTKCFACGVGFPVRTKDGGPGNPDPSKNPRADGFSLYTKTVGEMLLKSLVPKTKQAIITQHKEKANQFLKGATYEQLGGKGSQSARKQKEIGVSQDKSNILLPDIPALSSNNQPTTANKPQPSQPHLLLSATPVDPTADLVQKQILNADLTAVNSPRLSVADPFPGPFPDPSPVTTKTVVTVEIPPPEEQAPAEKLHYTPPRIEEDEDIHAEEAFMIIDDEPRATSDSGGLKLPEIATLNSVSRSELTILQQEEIEGERTPQRKLHSQRHSEQGHETPESKARSQVHDLSSPYFQYSGTLQPNPDGYKSGDRGTLFSHNSIPAVAHSKDSQKLSVSAKKLLYSGKQYKEYSASKQNQNILDRLKMHGQPTQVQSRHANAKKHSTEVQIVSAGHSRYFNNYKAQQSISAKKRSKIMTGRGEIIINGPDNRTQSHTELPPIKTGGSSTNETFQGRQSVAVVKNSSQSELAPTPQPSVLRNKTHSSRLVVNYGQNVGKFSHNIAGTKDNSTSTNKLRSAYLNHQQECQSAELSKKQLMIAKTIKQSKRRNKDSLLPSQSSITPIKKQPKSVHDLDQYYLALQKQSHSSEKKSKKSANSKTVDRRHAYSKIEDPVIMTLDSLQTDGIKLVSEVKQLYATGERDAAVKLVLDEPLRKSVDVMRKEKPAVDEDEYMSDDFERASDISQPDGQPLTSEVITAVTVQPSSRHSAPMFAKHVTKPVVTTSRTREAAQALTSTTTYNQRASAGVSRTSGLNKNFRTSQTGSTGKVKQPLQNKLMKPAGAGRGILTQNETLINQTSPGENSNSTKRLLNKALTTVGQQQTSQQALVTPLSFDKQKFSQLAPVLEKSRRNTADQNRPSSGIITNTNQK